MKIGIITLYGEENYGNKFQNYAVKKMIEKINHSIHVDTIKPKLTNKQKIFMILVKLGISGYKNYRKDNYDKSKKDNFSAFSKKYLNPISFKNVNTLNRSYDLFFAGSDQIWNTNGFKESMLDFFLLSFADNQKRIAISPSLGTGEIKEEQLAQFKREIPKFKMLSCRENSGVSVLENISNGKKCIKLSDPTIGLSKDEWNSIRELAKGKPKDDYVFCYFLGKVDEEIKEQVKQLKKENKVVEIMKKNDISIFSNNPSQFIDLLADSKLLITDSFHGCVFAIIFNLPFVVLHTKDRLNMEDRIISLLNEFDLEERWIDNLNYNNIYNIDYRNSNKKLEDERNKLISYVSEALK